LPVLAPGLGQGALTIVLQVGALAVAIVIVSGLLGRPAARKGSLFVATAVVVGVVSLALVADDLGASATQLVHAERASTGPEAGLDHCFDETGAEGRIPFVDWLRARMPPDAVYGITVSGQPDLWCITLALLPRLPAYGSVRPGWFVAFGAIPPALGSAIARHEPSVELYAPGLALERLGG
jgi:hypothetical protein